MKRSYSGLLLWATFTVFAQEQYPRDAFIPPLDIPLVLAGTFGELRSNHFHSGIDIKTQQRQGLAVYAVAGGTVTRIKVGHWGYGKVLYVAHPNGFTSVYAHLQKFSPGIEEFVKKAQYTKESYEVEIFPDFGELRVAQGEIIAYSGNTGGSSGPHLHFEIRNSISERPVNPLLCGLAVRDATNPTLLELYGYPLSADAKLNQSDGPVRIKFNRLADGTYLADKVVATGTIGFGINTYDRQDLAANRNGVYKLVQRVNGEVYSDIEFDSFSFSETRYINTLIDYAHFGRFHDRILRCFKGPGNKLGLYNTLFNDGKINVAEGEEYHVDIDILDVMGNVLELRIPVEGRLEALKIFNTPSRTPDLLIARRPNNYDLGIAKVYFPANTFYEDFYIDLKKGQDTVTIHNNTVPAHRNFTITFDASRLSAEERNRSFISRLDEKMEPSHLSTYKRGNTFTARTRNLGTYTLLRDTVPPKIWAKNFKSGQWLANYHYLSLHISDDLSGIDTYRATLNGEWILMEYEPKTNTLTYNFDDKIGDETQCELQLTVTDNVGNSTTFISNFYRK